MNFDDIKSALPEHVNCYYNGLTAEDVASCPVDHWAGQCGGVWYLGTEVEVPSLERFRIV